MKPLSVKLELENQCLIDWKKMEKIENDFYCSQCEKNVIDMVDWDDAQIMEYFNKNPNKVCAKINHNRLDRILNVQSNPPVKQRFSSRFLTLLFSFLGYTTFVGKAHQSSDSNFLITNLQSNKSDENIIISGNVTLEGLPLKDCKIEFLGKLYYSDSLGNYRISINKVDLRNSLIQFSYSGFPIETRSYNVAMGSTNYSISFYTRKYNSTTVVGGINPTFFIPSSWVNDYIEVTNKKLEARTKSQLDEIASRMKINPNFGMAIQGYYYKDSISVKKNLNVIKNYLVEVQGIDPERIFLNKLIKTSMKKEESKFHFVPPTYE